MVDSKLGNKSSGSVCSFLVPPILLNIESKSLNITKFSPYKSYKYLIFESGINKTFPAGNQPGQSAYIVCNINHRTMIQKDHYTKCLVLNTTCCTPYLISLRLPAFCPYNTATGLNLSKMKSQNKL